MPLNPTLFPFERTWYACYNVVVQFCTTEAWKMTSAITLLYQRGIHTHRLQYLVGVELTTTGDAEFTESSLSMQTRSGRTATLQRKPC